MNIRTLTSWGAMLLLTGLILSPASSSSNDQSDVERSDESALAWLTSRAEAGDAWAMYSLARAHRTKLQSQVAHETPLHVWYPESAAEHWRRCVQLIDSEDFQATEKDMIHWFKKSCDAGMPEAMVGLSELYIDGRGVLQDIDKGIALLRQGADLEFAPAVSMLGYHYGNGTGGPGNRRMAWRHYITGYAMGCTVSASNIGYYYTRGYCGMFDDEQGLDWIRYAARLDEDAAMFLLGEYYEDGRIVPQDNQAALEWYHMAAERGSENAMHRLARVYRYGHLGVEKDDRMAFRWYHEAALNLHPKAAFWTGVYLREGRAGVEKNFPEAVHWFRVATERGYEAGYWRLGYMHDYGEGVEQNYGEALRLYQRAIDSFYGDKAAYHIGIIHEFAKGVEKDFTLAAEWYQRAADRGHASAKVRLGRLCKRGWGVPPDSIKALRLFEEAMADDNVDAFREAGNMYMWKHRDIELDLPKAVELLMIAADRGDAEAMADLGCCYSQKMPRTPENQKLAGEWYLNAAAAGEYWSLGIMMEAYEKGRFGFPVDLAQARIWAERAAAKGSRFAREFLERHGAADQNTEDALSPGADPLHE